MSHFRSIDYLSIKVSESNPHFKVICPHKRGTTFKKNHKQINTLVPTNTSCILITNYTHLQNLRDLSVNFLQTRGHAFTPLYPATITTKRQKAAKYFISVVAKETRITLFRERNVKRNAKRCRVRPTRRLRSPCACARFINFFFFYFSSKKFTIHLHTSS